MVIGRLAPATPQALDAALDRAAATFTRWRLVPAPRRGELVRLFGEQLRAHQDALAAVVTLETGKILAKARGEVQEMIDVCDFAVGRSHARGPGHSVRRGRHRWPALHHPAPPDRPLLDRR
jgi:aldehyde dehydrogenase (NAD+)